MSAANQSPVRLTPAEVGQRIREARLAKGWTHEELARRMNANWRTVQRWQKGELPRLSRLVQLAEVLGVPEGYFIEAEDSVATLNDLRARVDDLAVRVDALARALAALAPAQPAPPPESPEPRRRSTT
jgi:transcriptional regulator with XRE-family HTH domain